MIDMNDVVIRKMKGKELKRVIEINRKELYPELEGWQIQQWMDGEGVFSPESFIVLLDKKIVGFIVLEIYEIRGKEAIWEISAIAVSQEYQKKGIGTKLLREAISEIQESSFQKGFKAKGILIETGTDEATGFYEKVFSSFQKKVIERTWIDREGMVIYFVPLS